MKNCIKRVKSGLSGNDGAMSALVILMMIALITFGAFSISYANVNLKFGGKAVDWNKVYFELDSGGESFLCELSGLLAKAELDALGYVQDALKGGSPAATGLPETLSRRLEAVRGSAITPEFLNETINLIYLHLSYIEFINLFSEDEADGQVTAMRDIPGESVITGVKVMFNVRSEGNENAHLQVALVLNGVDYDFAIRSGSIEGVKFSSDSAFTILEWRQWQKAAEAEPSSGQLWEGFR